LVAIFQGFENNFMFDNTGITKHNTTNYSSLKPKTFSETQKQQHQGRWKSSSCLCTR